jgi:hypothetical protein
MPVTARHVVFSTSAAIDLRKALAQIGRRDRVVALYDDLSFGPIDPPDPVLRAQWVKMELGYEDWGEIDSHVQKFWKAALSDRHRRIAWMSRRSAHDYAGFLEFVSRLGDSPCEVVDLTEATVLERHKDREPPARRLAICLAIMSAHDIVENNLLDQAHALTEQMRADYLARWTMLRSENAALRVLDADLQLRSAPISFFDQQLLSCASHRWLKSARIIGDTLMKCSDGGRHQIGDVVLAARLRSLVEAGILEGQGDLLQIRFSEVRLPAISA